MYLLCSKLCQCHPRVYSAFLDLGDGKWKTEAFTDWSHQHSARPSRQFQATLPVLLWRRQNGEVLGPRVQQGNPHHNKQANRQKIYNVYMYMHDSKKNHPPKISTNKKIYI